MDQSFMDVNCIHEDHLENLSLLYSFMFLVYSKSQEILDDYNNSLPFKSFSVHSSPVILIITLQSPRKKILQKTHYKCNKPT
jgi:hypothetical protein